MYRLPIAMLLGVFAMFGVMRLMASHVGFAQEDAPRHVLVTDMAQRSVVDGDEMVIPRDESGQFYVDVEANGQASRFLIDTGADFVALTVTEAENLALDFDPANFVPVTRTASGVGMGQRVTVGQMTIGNHEFHDVEAYVIDGLGTNLLGQSILSRFGRVEMRGDEMVIGHAT